MTLARINKAQSNLKNARVAVIAMEQRLALEVRAFVNFRASSLRNTAKSMGISAAYLSDVVNGKRKVSEALIEALKALK